MSDWAAIGFAFTHSIIWYLIICMALEVKLLDPILVIFGLKDWKEM